MTNTARIRERQLKDEAGVFPPYKAAHAGEGEEVKALGLFGTMGLGLWVDSGLNLGRVGLAISLIRISLF